MALPAALGAPRAPAASCRSPLGHQFLQDLRVERDVVLRHRVKPLEQPVGVGTVCRKIAVVLGLGLAQRERAVFGIEGTVAIAAAVEQVGVVDQREAAVERFRVEIVLRVFPMVRDDRVSARAHDVEDREACFKLARPCCTRSIDRA